VAVLGVIFLVLLALAVLTLLVTLTISLPDIRRYRAIGKM
jgi:hypothetical protein